MIYGFNVSFILNIYYLIAYITKLINKFLKQIWKKILVIIVKCKISTANPFLT